MYQGCSFSFHLVDSFISFFVLSSSVRLIIFLSRGPALWYTWLYVQVKYARTWEQGMALSSTVFFTLLHSVTYNTKMHVVFLISLNAWFDYKKCQFTDKSYFKFNLKGESSPNWVKNMLFYIRLNGNNVNFALLKQQLEASK